MSQSTETALSEQDQPEPSQSRAPVPRQASFTERLRSNPATAGIIIATGLVFLGQIASEQIFGFDLLLALGAKQNSAILQGQLWRYFTPILIHVGYLHFFINMYSLYVIGPPVERPFGPIRYISVYFLSGLGGVAASIAFSQAPSAGASGAIFGLLGALAGFLFRHRELLGRAGTGQLRHIVMLAIINLAIGLSPGIDNWGHFGGLITGLALSFWLGPEYQVEWNPEGIGRMVDQRRWRSVWPRAIGAGALVVLFLVAATLSPA
ncbi:MAG: rhomboid family intramembrane serine protease [Anaerolineales bacterium]